MVPVARFIYETGVAVKSQIATQICGVDNNGASRRGRKNLEPGQDEEQEESARYVTESKTCALTPRLYLTISDLSVRESLYRGSRGVRERERDCVDTSLVRPAGGIAKFAARQMLQGRSST